MVAKIAVGSSLFGVLAYNAEKVKNSEAKILEANKIEQQADAEFNMRDCMSDFFNFIPSHHNIAKPIIHISLNPHPDDKLSDAMLSEIAVEYLEKMGYGNQPYLIFKHEDISRHHIHIVTLGIDENGAKLNTSNNFYKSKKITRELEQKYDLRAAEKQLRSDLGVVKKVNAAAGDVKRQVGNIVKQVATRYHCLSFNEYRALLSLYNISAQEVKGEVKGVPYNGVVYSATNDAGEKVGNPFKSSLFGKSVGYDSLQARFANSKDVVKDSRFAPQTKRRVAQALHRSPSKSKFEKELRKAGIDVVFRQNDNGRIYGVTFVDHNNGCVLNGSRLGKELSANAITEWFKNPVSAQTSARASARTSAFAEQNSSQTQQADSFNRDESSSFGSLFGLSFDLQSADYQEEEAIRLAKRKKKKKSQKH